jgi:putative transcriptional regulator
MLRLTTTTDLEPSDDRGRDNEMTGPREAHLGNRLKDLRTAAGLTQLQLADLAGVSRKTVNTLENKVLTPSTVLALRLSRALDTPLESLFFLQE